jgi:hypothetical protein
MRPLVSSPYRVSRGLCPQTPEVFRFLSIPMGLASSRSEAYGAATCSEDRALLRSNPSAAAGSNTDGAGSSDPASSSAAWPPAITRRGEVGS